jgi:nucleoside-diphosphate-sugar epimerase
MQKKVILITGATGYLGSHLAYGLLKEGHKVVALVRETDKGVSVSEKALKAISAVNDKEQIPVENLIAVPGDVSDNANTLADTIRAHTRSDIDEIWHCAVIFTIQKTKKPKVEAINIKGTENLLDLALQINSERPPRFFYVSTAYSSGRDQAVIREEITPNIQNFRSLYEWSKHKAETLVECYQKKYDLDATIFRPSIVVGSPDTKVMNYSGYYQICKELSQLYKRYEEKAGPDFDRDIKIRVSGNPDALLNLVPIDYVIEAMNIVSNKPELKTNELKIFNIVNEAPVTLSLIHKIVSESLNIGGLELVEQDAFEQASMNSLEKMFARRSVFQMPYMNEDISFSNDRFRDVVSVEELPNPTIDSNFLRAINRIFFEQIEQVTPDSGNGNENGDVDSAPHHIRWRAKATM